MIRLTPVLCGLAFGTLPATAQEHFGYSGAHGPEHWGETCAIGGAQSPVDLAAAVPGPSLRDMGLQAQWVPVEADVENNGHTIVVNPADPAGAIGYLGTVYHFRQVHFHHLSEHVVEGQHADLEAHFVNQSDAGDYLVVGVFLRATGGPSDFSDFFSRVMGVAPAQAETRAGMPGLMNVGALLAAGERYYSYEGSLTTPPCSQNVTWLVQAVPQVMEVPLAAGQRFVELIGQNARPVQPLNGRTVYLH